MKSRKVNTNMSFKERSELAIKALANQKPVTLEQARMQVLCVALRSEERSSEDKEIHVKHLLKMYNPDWSEDQINLEWDRILENPPKPSWWKED